MESLSISLHADTDAASPYTHLVPGIVQNRILSFVPRPAQSQRGAACDISDAQADKNDEV